MTPIVDVANVSPTQRLYHPHDAFVFSRRKQTVYVIRHEHVRVNCAVLGHRDLAKVWPIALIVDRGNEAGLPIVPTFHDVLRDVGKIKSW